MHQKAEQDKNVKELLYLSRLQNSELFEKTADTWRKEASSKKEEPLSDKAGHYIQESKTEESTTKPVRKKWIVSLLLLAAVILALTAVKVFLKENWNPIAEITEDDSGIEWKDNALETF